jgi:hypothetical protein
MVKSGPLGGPGKKPRSTDVSPVPSPRPQPPLPGPNPPPAPPGPRVQQRRVNIPAKPDGS